MSVVNDGVELVLRAKDNRSALKKMFSTSGNQKKVLLIPGGNRRNRLAEITEKLMK